MENFKNLFTPGEIDKIDACLIPEIEKYPILYDKKIRNSTQSKEHIFRDIQSRIGPILQLESMYL